MRSPGQAREFVAKALLGLPLASPDMVWDAQLVVSELVANAVLHARTDLHVGLAYDDQVLLIAVADGHADSPATDVSRDEEYDEGARGMTLVAGIAADFGWERHEEVPGKTMWATLDLRGPDAVERP